MKRIEFVFVMMIIAATILSGQADRGTIAGLVTDETGGVQPSEYQARRAALAKAMGPAAVFIGFSVAPVRRSGDIDWPFRQEDNLLYLTGVNSPDTTLAIVSGDHSETIFVTDRNPSREAWTGKIATHEEITATSGIRDVESSERFESFIDAVFQGRGWGESKAYGFYRPPSFPNFLQSFREGRSEVWLLLEDRSQSGAPTREQRFAEQLSRRFPAIRIRNASPILSGMPEVKSPVEMSLIQRAIDITAEAQKAAMRRVLTASRENEVQSTIEYTFRNLGACCWAFPSIVGAGEKYKWPRPASAEHTEAVDKSVSHAKVQVAVKNHSFRRNESMKSYVFRVLVEEDVMESGEPAFHASCPALKGCHTWGHTYDEALANIREAIELYVEDIRESGGAVPYDPNQGVIEWPTPAVAVNL